MVVFFPGLSWALLGSPGLPWAPWTRLDSPGLPWALLWLPGPPGLLGSPGVSWGSWALLGSPGPLGSPGVAGLCRSGSRVLTQNYHLYVAKSRFFPWDPQRRLKLPLGVGPEPQRRPKCVKVFARGCLGVVVALEMAARACLGHTGAFKFAARAFLGGAGAFEVAAPGLPRNRKGVRNGCSRLRRSLTLLCAPFSCMDMHGFTLHAYL